MTKKWRRICHCKNPQSGHKVEVEGERGRLMGYGWVLIIKEQIRKDTPFLQERGQGIGRQLTNPGKKSP